MRSIILLALATLILSCNSTHIVNSWKAQNAEVNESELGQVIVMALIVDEATRISIEDNVVRLNEEIKISYKDFPSKDILEDEEAFMQIIKKKGYDGILTFRIVEIKDEQVYEPGNFSGGYWGYHNVFYPGFYDPNFFKENTKYLIETSVFSFTQDKQLWTATTSTTNPKNIKKAAREIVNEVRKQMVRDGFLIGTEKD